MKKFATFVMLLSTSLFTIGCGPAGGNVSGPSKDGGATAAQPAADTPPAPPATPDAPPPATP